MSDCVGDTLLWLSTEPLAGMWAGSREVGWSLARALSDSSHCEKERRIVMRIWSEVRGSRSAKALKSQRPKLLLWLECERGVPQRAAL